MLKSQTLSENMWTTYVESMASRNYRQQPYWAQHTYLNK